MSVARRDLGLQNPNCGFSNCGGLGGPCIYAGGVGGIIGLPVLCDGSSGKHRGEPGEAFGIAELTLCFSVRALPRFVRKAAVDTGGSTNEIFQSAGVPEYCFVNCFFRSAL